MLPYRLKLNDSAFRDANGLTICAPTRVSEAVRRANEENQQWHKTVCALLRDGELKCQCATNRRVGKLCANEENLTAGAVARASRTQVINRCVTLIGSWLSERRNQQRRGEHL